MRATVGRVDWAALVVMLAGAIGAGAQHDGWANPGSAPQDLTPAEGYVYFTAEDGIHGRELWRTDGTHEGTILVQDFNPGPAGSRFASLAAWGADVYFAGNPVPGDAADYLWRVTGDPPAIEKVVTEAQEHVQVVTIQTTNPLAVLDQTLFVISYRGRYQWLHSVSLPGAIATPLPAPDLKYDIFGVGQLFPGERVLYVGAAYNVSIAGAKDEFWLFRITPEPWRMEAAEPGVDHRLQILGTLGDSLLFAGQTLYDAIGEEPYIWRYDEPAPRLLKDIAPGIGSGLGQDYGTCRIEGGRLFVANDDVHGWEPWITDGTEEGTRLLRDIHPGRESSAAGMWSATRDVAFFQAQTRETGIEMWVTDGTTEGTRITKDIVPGPESSRPYRPAVAGDRVFFTSHHPVYGEELWVSDGSEDGTRLVKDIVPGAGSSEPFLKAPLGDRVVFTANDGIHGEEMWISDGTEDGTYMLKDIWPARGPNPSSDPQQLTAVGDLVFFVVNDARHGAELWRSDGTEPGTFLVKDIYPGRPSSSPSELCACGDYLFFQAEDPDHGVELWVSDGTPDGTFMLRDSMPGPASSNPHGLVCDGADLYYAADHPVVGVELWRYRIEGTPLPNPALEFFDVRPGKEGSYPRALTPGRLADGRRCLYFTADDGVHGRELFALVAGQVFLVSDIITNVPAGSNPTNLTPSGDTLYFNATSDTQGTELFRTKGTAESTEIVKDIR
jgi:ELWxxDGT repeat protein